MTSLTARVPGGNPEDPNASRLPGASSLSPAKRIKPSEALVRADRFVAELENSLESLLAKWRTSSNPNLSRAAAYAETLGPRLVATEGHSQYVAFELDDEFHTRELYFATFVEQRRGHWVEIPLKLKIVQSALKQQTDAGHKMLGVVIEPRFSAGSREVVETAMNKQRVDGARIFGINITDGSLLARQMDAAGAEPMPFTPQIPFP